MNAHATPTVAERVAACLRRPPADWATASALSRVLSVPRQQVLAALRQLAAAGAAERDFYDDGELTERWRLSR
jgi:Mn-dependent DtxR family transcriptional regulator